MSAPCPTCGAQLDTPLCCTSCGALFAVTSELDPFDLLGLPREFRVDAGAVRRRLRTLTRHMHPDFFGTASAEQRTLAERNTAALNEAHEELSDDLRRADGLVRRLGGPDEAAERQMPQEFLMEVLEWNESLEEARSPERASSGLDALEAELRARRDATLEQVSALLAPLPEPGAPALTELRRRLNALRYLQKTLTEIGALRLTQANTR
jgi:molecular chaperone HscB